MLSIFYFISSDFRFETGGKGCLFRFPKKCLGAFNASHVWGLKTGEMLPIFPPIHCWRYVGFQSKENPANFPKNIMMGLCCWIMENQTRGKCCPFFRKNFSMPTTLSCFLFVILEDRGEVLVSKHCVMLGSIFRLFSLTNCFGHVYFQIQCFQAGLYAAHLLRYLWLFPIFP